MQTYLFLTDHLLSAFVNYKCFALYFICDTILNIYLHSPAILLRFKNQQLKLSTSLEFLKTIKKLSEKTIIYFVSCVTICI